MLRGMSVAEQPPFSNQQFEINGQPWGVKQNGQLPQNGVQSRHPQTRGSSPSIPSTASFDQSSHGMNGNLGR